MIRTTNRIVSTFRSTVTVDSLRRINNVTGTEFPVSGDAPLRYEFEALKAKMEQTTCQEIHPAGGPGC